MGPRGFNVHLSGALDAVPFAPGQEHQAVSLALDYVLGETLHVDALDLVLPDLERVLRVGILEEVIQFLIVDLEERAVGCYFQALRADCLVQLTDAPGNDALVRVWRQLLSSAAYLAVVCS